jgi:hypothetical protein
MRLKHPNFSARLLDSRARTKPSNHRHVIASPIVRLISRIVVQGNPYLRFGRREAEVRWHYTDDLTAHAFKLD